jgi:hypothetical protein
MWNLGMNYLATFICSTKGDSNMQFVIRSVALSAAICVCGAALAHDDACQPLRDQYAQSCVNIQATNKWGAVLMGTTCVIAARAIQKCESQESDSTDNPTDDDGDDN